MKLLTGAVLAASLLWTPAGVQAETGSCSEPSVIEMKNMLADAAKKYDVPVEIVKGIASKESGGLYQCKNGAPLVTSDGGIGIMQVTLSPGDHPEIDRERLKTDAAYNIDQGVSILKEKYTIKTNPVIENQSPYILEHWYFAVRNYNGNSGKNDPTQHPGSTYQELVYKNMSQFGNTVTTPFPVKNYDPNWKPGNAPMQWAYGYTASAGDLNKGDKVITKEPINNLRKEPNTKMPKLAEIGPNATVEILSDELFEDDNRNNLFGYYYVKVNGKTGYMASSNLKPLRIETANPLSINPNRKEGYGRIKLLKNVSSYKLVSGKEQPFKTYAKGAALRVYGTNNGSYNVGGGVYVKHDPAETKLVMAVAVDSRNKVAGYASEDKLLTIVMENGEVKYKKDGYKLFLGYVESAKPLTMYRSNGTVLKTLPANTGYRVHEIKNDRYDIGGGYYVKKTGTSYSPVFGGN
ncbi:transglycosylase SLT domain-containing protein [Metabacillus sp. FJAT-52054]|uniref:Transglycosylase SLT domain-containing protein n=1 Tax=Metabacillus sediminis TaxID=3117746 RepID=A0ABZ2NGB0_9BACI